MKPRHYSTVFAICLLIVGLTALLVACSGSDNTTTTRSTTSSARTTTTLAVSVSGVGEGLTNDEFSTFRSKDPFIQQALPPTSTSTTATTAPTSSTTTTHYTTTSYHTTTTRPSGTTTTTHATSTTTTTAAHLHYLKILSVGTVSGAPATTFRVDGTVYKDKRTGDVVSTTWGQVKVLDISVSSKVVTLLHGSETLTLSEGQQTYE